MNLAQLNAKSQKQVMGISIAAIIPQKMMKVVVAPINSGLERSAILYEIHRVKANGPKE
jgi:hypothetical protein